METGCSYPSKVNSIVKYFSDPPPACPTRSHLAQTLRSQRVRTLSCLVTLLRSDPGQCPPFPLLVNVCTYVPVARLSRVPTPFELCLKWCYVSHVGCACEKKLLIGVGGYRLQRRRGAHVRDHRHPVPELQGSAGTENCCTAVLLAKVSTLGKEMPVVRALWEYERPVCLQSGCRSWLIIPVWCFDRRAF